MKDQPTRRFFVVIAVFVLSLSILCFEVVLTRIFSVMLSYHFVFAIISFALLGLGLGGLLLARWRRRFQRATFAHTTTVLALSIGVSVYLMTQLPITGHAFPMEARLAIYLLLAITPFLFAGIVFAELFQRYADFSSILYGTDLLGATLGVVVAVVLLDAMGGVRAALLAGEGVAVAALVFHGAFAETRGKRLVLGKRLVFPSLVALGLLALLLLPGGLDVPVVMDANKDMSRFLNNPADDAEIVESRWSAFGRTDLVRSSQTPDQMTLFVDGAAGSAMYNLPLLLEDDQKSQHLRSHYGAYFPFFFLDEKEKETALIIGSGGGRDVVVALLGGVPSITAVEVNPDVVGLVQDYAEFNGGIYTDHPNVAVQVQEGRNYLRTTDDLYDLIMMALPITKSSRSVEGYALTENHLFTVEAFGDYLNHLTPEGRLLFVTHSNIELYRLVVLALAAFEQQGIGTQAAMQHIYTVNPGTMPTLIVKKTAFDALDIEPRHALMHDLNYDMGNFFVPYAPQEPQTTFGQLNLLGMDRMFDQILVDISTGKLPVQALITYAPFDLSPVTDDSPFFFKYTLGLPAPFPLLMLLIILVVGVWVTVMGFHRRYVRSRHPALAALSASRTMRTLLWVAFFLGIGFMLLEIALFQKLALYMPHPIFALTVLLFTLLLGTGLGSLCSALTHHRLAEVLVGAALVVAVSSFLATKLLPVVFETVLEPKLAATLFLVPVGFFLGFPFPLSIRLMSKADLAPFVDLLWGINGIASVIGSSLAMIIGITFNFTGALFLGGILYLSIALVMGWSLRNDPNLKSF